MLYPKCSECDFKKLIIIFGRGGALDELSIFIISTEQSNIACVDSFCHGFIIVQNETMIKQ